MHPARTYAGSWVYYPVILTTVMATTAPPTPSPPRLHVDFGANAFGLFGSVSINDDLWWPMEHATPLRIDHQVLSQRALSPANRLSLVASHTTTGHDTFGTYTRVAHVWGSASSDHGPHQQDSVVNPLSTPRLVLETACRTYASRPNLAVFDTVALSAWMGTNSSRGDASPITQFPVINVTDTGVDGGVVQNASYTLWTGLWPLPAVRRVGQLATTEMWQRRHDGPVMLTAPDRTTVVVGPVNDTLNMVYTHVGSGGSGNGNNGNGLAFGPSGMLTSVPQGRAFQIMMVAGLGPTTALRSYGQLHVMASTGGLSTPPLKLPDPFVEAVSAFTDNGAYYYWNADGVKVLPAPNTVLPTWIKALRRDGVSTRGLQLDGWWMNQTTLAPNNDLFNTTWQAFRSAIGAETPLMLYKAFFAPTYDLFATFQKVQSPKGPWYPAAVDALPFFRALFAQGRELGMMAYETDFMSDHWLPTPALSGTVDGLQTYLHGLGQAGVDLGIPMQWCMPTAGIAMFAARLPAVTNLRVSVDYACEGPADLNVTWPANFAIGIGSLLFDAVGVVPSKDVLQTTASQPGMIPVCGSAHAQPNVELDLVLAVLSTGPVGLGDGLGETNVSLAMRCCRADGVILKPSTPLAAVDSMFVPTADSNNHVGFLPMGSVSDGDCTAQRPCSPALHQTHANVSLLPSYATAVGLTSNALIYRHLVSINLGSFEPPVTDLWPAVSRVPASPSYFWREWRWDHDCETAGPASQGRCGTWLVHPSPNTSTDGTTARLPDVSSGSHRLAPNGSIAWRLFAMFPTLPLLQPTRHATARPVDTTRASSMVRGWTLLGELDKVVPVSSLRFSLVHVDAMGCVGFWLACGVEETVLVTAIAPNGTFVRLRVVNATCGRVGQAPCRMC
eukprot:m.192438 g.192438  ORF g.192438 m.192438 type:complete len:897 (-) comp18641_c0_seq1:102-2792(-)